MIPIIIKTSPKIFMMIFSWAATTFKNRAFIYYLSATALFWFSLNLFIIIVPFFSQHVLGQRLGHAAEHVPHCMHVRIPSQPGSAVTRRPHAGSASR